MFEYKNFRRNGVTVWGYIETDYYPSSNPSGFITGSVGGGTGDYYPNSNPSGFIGSAQTGQFYPASNPSGYIGAAQTGQFASDANLIATGNSAQIQINTITNWTGTSTGLYYPRTSNPSGYLVVGGATTGFLYLPIQQAKLPTGNPSPARIDASELNWRLLYSATVNQSALWQFIMPNNFHSNLQARIHFTMNTVQTGTNSVAWQTLIASITPDNYNVDVGTWGFAANSGLHTLTNNQPAGYVRQSVIPLSANSGVAGDFVMFQLRRLASDGVDTATFDAEVIGLSLEFI